MVYRR